MKNILKISILTILLITTSCSNNDNTGTLKVINQTECIQNIFDGLNSNSNLLGTVIENETKNFTIELGELESSGTFFYSDPQNCDNSIGEQYKVTINANQVTTIVIE